MPLAVPHLYISEGFPGGPVVKNPPQCRDVRDAGLIPGSGRYPGEGNGHPFQHSCLENSMDRGGLQFMGLQIRA